VWYFTPQRRKGVSSKLLHPWQGPFRIIKVTSPVNVELKSLENDKRPIEVVHITKIKPYKGKFDFVNSGEQEIKKVSDQNGSTTGQASIKELEIGKRHNNY